jgi:Uncharacterized conserved protein (DUF2183)
MPATSYYRAARLVSVLALSSFFSIAACASNEEQTAAAEADQTAFRLPNEGSCEAEAMKKVANEATLEQLDNDAALARPAAENLIASRPFESVRQIDDVAQVGSAALSALLGYARAQGYLGACAPASSEVGVISDLDKTVIPEAEPDLSEAPYPGVKTLLHVLEHHAGGAAGDVYYVTARTPEKVADVPAYLESHGVPSGHFETGTSGVPWLAQAEKVRDIKGIFQRTGAQRFVLFGDTAHRDPEVYKEVIAAQPERVIAAFIHKVNATVAPSRVEGLHLHESYAEVAAILYSLQTITRDEALDVMKAAKDEGLAITSVQMEELLDAHQP